MEVPRRSMPEERGLAEPLLTLTEVCDALRISIHTGRKLVQSGRLPCYRNGGITRFTEEHVAAFLTGEQDPAAVEQRQIKEPGTPPRPAP